MSNKWPGKYGGISDSMKSTSQTCHKEALSLFSDVAQTKETFYFKTFLFIME
jgi:hypothetical protein